MKQEQCGVFLGSCFPVNEIDLCEDSFPCLGFGMIFSRSIILSFRHSAVPAFRVAHSGLIIVDKKRRKSIRILNEGLKIAYINYISVK